MLDKSAGSRFRRLFGEHANDQARQAIRSRINTTDHSITERKKEPNKYIAHMEKKAASSISKGFKFTPSTTGVTKTKPSMPKPSKELKAPKLINQKVDNPNKSLVKKSSYLDKAKALASSVGTFSSNAAKGTVKSVGTATKDVVQHAGGKKLRDHARTNLGMRQRELHKFMGKSDKEKLRTLGERKAKEVRNLMQKRDASRVAVGLGAVGAGAAGVAGKAKYDEHKAKKEYRRRLAMQAYLRQQQGYR